MKVYKTQKSSKAELSWMNYHSLKKIIGIGTIKYLEFNYIKKVHNDFFKSNFMDKCRPAVSAFTGGTINNR